MRVMTPEEIIGVVVAVVFTAGVAGAVSVSRLPRPLKVLICAALALRVVGSWLRYTILFEFYDGSGDAMRYYRKGVEYADRLWQLDFSPFFDSSLWLREHWWGTTFVPFPSGVILSIIGPSPLGEFLVFSLMAFLGLVGFAIAFRQVYPHVPLSRYARWIWLFPSLWYWPSSVGKEAVLLMGLGLSVAGFIGRRERINWLLLSVGVFFVFAIRPQVAAVVLVAFVLAQWLSLGARWTVRKAVQGLLILAMGLGGTRLAMTSVGLDGLDTEGVIGYIEAESKQEMGDSRIAPVGPGLTKVPVALVNILGRPFIWEARNPMMLLSALEILAFWVIVWLRRRNVVQALRQWRTDRFLRLAVPFVFVYAITLGMVITNLGVLARQRIFLFPFLFVLLEAMPAQGGQRAVVHRRARLPADGVRRAVLEAGGLT